MKFGTEISGVDNLHSAQTGTCFRAGPLAFTHIGKALVEVIEVPVISPVGGTKPWFAGVAVYRSELLPVTDFTHWAGLNRKPDAHKGFANTGLQSSDARIRQRILVVQRLDNQRLDNSSEQIEKIGLLVDEVSGHVLLEQAATMHSGKTELTAILRQQLQKSASGSASESATISEPAPELSPQLLELVKGAWSSPAKVFLVELQQLFAMDAFTRIALQASDKASIAKHQREVMYS